MEKALGDQLTAVLETLPEKLPRSRLDPYREFVAELRRRGYTYRDISHILAEKCDVRVTASGIHDFVRRRLDSPTTSPSRRIATRPTTAEPITMTGVHAESQVSAALRKVAALKHRAMTTDSSPKVFEFNSDEPLRLKNPDKP